jgi:EmrB/QacA subfamily drug resistance transporter
VISAYTLVAGGFLLLGGRVADIAGRRLLFVLGLALFTSGSLLCGLAWTHGALIAFRALQGFGAAFVAPAALSLITALFDEGADRNKALGIMGAISGSGAAFGVLLGGVLTSAFSWKWIFFVNVPVGVAAMIVTFLIIPESHGHLGHRRFDIAGAATATASLTVLTYAIVKASDYGWGSAKTIGLLAASLAGLGVFVAIERRSRAPLMPLRIWLNRTLSGANVVGFTLGASIFAMFFILSLYMQQVLGYSALQAGVAYLACALTVVVAAGIAGRRLTPRIGPKPVIALGMLLAATGMVMITGLGVDSSYAPDVLPALCVFGLGMGLTMATAIGTATLGVRAADAGVASAMVNTGQQVGGSIGTAVLSTLASTAATNYVHGKVPSQAVFAQAAVHGYTTAFWISAGIFAAGAILAGALVRPGVPVADPAAPPAFAH